MKIIKDNIYCKRFGYFNIYVIKGNNGDILIDTGFILMRKKLIKWLDNFNIKLIIITHAHIDHIWNVKYLKDRYKCKIGMGKEDIINIDNTNIEPKPINKFYKYRTKLMKFGMKNFKPDKFKVDIEIINNTIINKYGIKLKCISLKGHTNGSIGILYKNILIAGDALVNRKLKAEVAYQNQNNEEAIKSAIKIYKLNPELILIGHELPITNKKLKKSINRIKNYNRFIK